MASDRDEQPTDGRTRGRPGHGMRAHRHRDRGTADSIVIDAETTDVHGAGGGGDHAAPDGAPEDAARARSPRPRRRRSFWRPLVIVIACLFLAVGLARHLLPGQVIPLPVWLVAEMEARVNAGMAGEQASPGAVLGLGGLSLAFAADLRPELVLADLRVVVPSGGPLAAFPEVRVALAPEEILRGRIRPVGVRLTGGRMALARDEEGRFTFGLDEELSGARTLETAADVLDAVDAFFSTPALAGLRLIEADGVALTLRDSRVGRRWEIGDGRIVIENRAEGIAAELNLTLLDGASHGQAHVVLETDKADSSARLFATVNEVAARDLAAQAPLLAALALVDAPISGRIFGALDADGRVRLFRGDLTAGAGEVNPAGGHPFRFDGGTLSLHYIPAQRRMALDRISVESASLRAEATGSADFLTARGGPVPTGQMPDAVLLQLDLGELMVDPEGLFEAPVRFASGNADIRLNITDMSADIGRVTLRDGDDRVGISGRIAATPAGWEAALDVAMNRITTRRLLTLWPLGVVTKTRDWLAENVGQGELSHASAALRLSPGQEPRFALDYRFSDAEVRFLRTLPPIADGAGWASIFGNVYTLRLEEGHVTAPAGGAIDVAGSVFQVLDIAQRPAQAEVTLRTTGPLGATLSLLDEEPFRFISRAGQPVDVGTGQTRLHSVIRFPLIRGLPVEDLSYVVEGEITDFSSARILPGHEIGAERLDIHVTRHVLDISGTASIDGISITGAYRQQLEPAGMRADGEGRGVGRARLSGTTRLDAGVLDRFGVALPDGMLRGETGLDLALDIVRGVPPALSVKSDLRGLALAVPTIGWRKPAGTAATLALDATLGAAPEVTALHLQAPGLGAEGRLAFGADGAPRASLSRLRIGSWLDAPAEITLSRGVPHVRLTGGFLDIGGLPRTGGDKGRVAGATPSLVLDLALDRVAIARGIALRAFRGHFTGEGGGFRGNFAGRVNGGAEILGATIPYGGRTAVRVTAEDAGGVLRATGLLNNVLGGKLDVTLQPEGEGQDYLGAGSIRNFAIRDAPALASILSAASIVGLVEQLAGPGIAFAGADIHFHIRPGGIEITHGSATGASMGLSFAGVYRAASRTIDLMGSISPFYLVNGIGEALGGAGEGLFGFNYRLQGPVAAPAISVNPFSVLAPGPLRNILRGAAPTLDEAG